jgi:hypothetical protein
LGQCQLAASNTLEHGHALLHEFIALDVHQIGAGQPVLRDENRFLVPLDIREELGGPTLEGGDEFGALQCHFGTCKC